MKILFLTKRRYTAKDLINDRYGRLYEFIAGLVGRGHRVALLCIEYGEATQVSPEALRLWPEVEWHVHATGRHLVRGLRAHVAAAERVAAALTPALVLSTADAFNVWLGDRLAREVGAPHVADLYDNFEAFGATRLPGVTIAYRRALRRCAGIVAVSPALADLVRARVRPSGLVTTIGNGADPTRFRPGNSRSARLALGLETDALLVGTAGSLSRSRGIEDLFRAYEQLRHVDGSIGLVVAGRLGPGVLLPQGSGSRYLGELPHEQAGLLFQALDVGVVCNRDSAFGRYCYPQKSVEMFSCGLPTVMADVGVARDMLGDCKSALYTPGDGRDLARAIAWQLENRCAPSAGGWDWAARVGALDAFLTQMVRDDVDAVSGGC